MLTNSLRDAFRPLRRAHTFALLTVSILAIGVGLNAAIFAVVDAVLLQALGYHNADRTVSVRKAVPGVVALTLAAAAIPARRASPVDPARALRTS